MGSVSNMAPSNPSRRRVLLTMGGGLMAASTGFGSIPAISASRTATTTIELGGDLSGWEGQEPSSIVGKTNPRLDLTEGTEYELIWENLDGATHDFQILNARDEILVNSRNEGTQGEMVTVTFTASHEMTRYRCSFHPSSMSGTINVESTPTPTPSPTPTSTATETPTATDTPTPTPTPAPSESYIVSNQGAEYYLIDDEQQPVLTLSRDHTYEFDVDTSGHPFHVSTDSTGGDFSGIYTQGITVTNPIDGRKATETGTLTFQVPTDAPDTLYYQCGIHEGMGHKLEIVDGGPPPLPGNENPPRDLDGDGLYEDIDGDGDFSVIDVQSLFTKRKSESVHDHAASFDFDGDDEFSIIDIQKLFTMLIK